MTFTDSARALHRPRKVEAQESLQIVLSRTQHHALEFLSTLSERSVSATVDANTLHHRLDVGISAQGTPATTVIDDLVAATKNGHLRSGSGRFFGWVIGGALPSSLAADWLVSTWDNNAALYTTGPAAAVCEEVVGAWIKDILRLPSDASFALTTGCQMAHVTCLAAARNALLHQRGWSSECDGLFGAPSIRVVTSTEVHGSVERAVKILGLGLASIVKIQSGENGTLDSATFSKELAKSDTATIVVLNAGDLNIAAMDSFSKLIPIAKAAGAWVHIDGAFGLWARASPRYCGQLEGIEAADSWATDAHKWLNTPKDIGIAVIRDTRAHYKAMSVKGSYINWCNDVRDQIDWTPDWTRRARCFPVYAALRELGRSGVTDLIDRCCRYATTLTTGIGALSGAELVVQPTLNQGLVRFLAPRGTEEDHNQMTLLMIDKINAAGTAFFSGSTWRGRHVMRISVVNWRTNESDVQWTIDSVRRVLELERAKRGIVE